MAEKFLLKYLIYNNTKGGSIDSENSLLTLIKTIKEIKINKNSKEIVINYKDEENKLNYKVYLFEKIQSNDNYNCITLNIEGNDVNSIEIFNSLFERLSNQLKPEIFEKFLIYDSISRYYSSASYKDIHDLESKMRSIITLFMSISVGKNWAIDYTKHLRSENESKKNLNHDFVYNQDFNRLTKVLFDKFNVKDQEISDLFIELKKDNPRIELIKKNIPKSNWERFFKEKMKNIDEKKLINDWDEIYKLRNKIAHNNTFTKNDYNRFSARVEKMSKILDDILEIIEGDSINITKEDGELIVDQAIAHNDSYKEFINIYSKFIDFYDTTRLISDEDNEIHNENNEEIDVLYKNVKDLRNKIAHKDESIKQEEFNAKIECLTSEMSNILQNDEKNESKNWDTIIVPARETGFQEVFINQKQWYDLRIGQDKLQLINDLGEIQLKYIAAYRTKPVSAITHWAEIKTIKESDNKLGYKKIIFKNKPTKLEKPIILDKPELAPQNNRYVNLERMKKVKTLSSLFELED